MINSHTLSKKCKTDRCFVVRTVCVYVYDTLCLSKSWTKYMDLIRHSDPSHGTIPNYLMIVNITFAYECLSQ